VIKPPGGYAATESGNVNEKARRMFLRVTLIAASAMATIAIGSASPANAQPPLKPGPHSAIADVDLPEGTVQCTTIACRSDLGRDTDPLTEEWRYSVPYDDIVAFLRKQFATGRRYDAHGATWWKGLPPCYDTNHQSPPWGWTVGDEIDWAWSDGVTRLHVIVDKPGIKTTDGNIVPFGRIVIFTVSAGTFPCYRA
jgi:hypothetical protein